MKKALINDPDMIEEEEITYYGKRLSVYRKKLFVKECITSFITGKSLYMSHYDDKIIIFIDNKGNRIRSNSLVGRDINYQIAIVKKLTQNF